MNKLFTKIATLSVGLAMAIGVGVAVGSKDAKETKAAGSGDWVQVTALSGLNTTDTYVIANNADKGYFMNGTVSSGHFQSTAFSASAPSSASAAGAFKLEAVNAGNNIYKIKLASTSKYVTASKAGSGGGVIDSSSDASGWRFLVDGTNFNAIYQKAYSNKYAAMRCYNNTSWRTYSNGNSSSVTTTSGTVFRLYKYQTATLSSISVKTSPKTSYIQGDYFDPTGLVITRTYSDSTSNDYAYAGHTSEFTFSPTTSTSLTTSHTSVTITYGGKSTSLAISVTTPKTPASLATTGQTASFEAGNTFAYGGTSTVTYTDSTSKTVTPSSFKIGNAGINPISAGTVIVPGTTVLNRNDHHGKTVYVLYEENSTTVYASYTISVAAISKISFVGGTDTGTAGGQGQSDTLTKSGISMSCDSCYTTSGAYRFYSGSTLTISSTVGNIAKIEFNMNGSYNSNLLSTSTGTYNHDDSSKGVWTGDAASIAFDLSAQARCDSVDITLASNDPLVELAPASSTEVSMLKGDSDTSVKVRVVNIASKTWTYTFDEDEDEGITTSSYISVSAGAAVSDVHTLTITTKAVGSTVLHISVSGTACTTTIPVTVAAKPASMMVTESDHETEITTLELQSGGSTKQVYWIGEDTDGNSYSIAAAQVNGEIISGSSYVSISSGAGTVITPVAAGTAVIRYSLKVLSSVYAEITVNVVDDYKTTVNSITFNSNLTDTQGDAVDTSAVFATKMANTHFGSTDTIADNEFLFSYENNRSGAEGIGVFSYDFSHGTTVDSTHKNQTIYVFTTFDSSYSGSFSITIEQKNDPLTAITITNVTNNEKEMARGTSFQLEIAYTPTNPTDGKEVVYRVDESDEGVSLTVSNAGLISVSASSGLGAALVVVESAHDETIYDWVDVSVVLETMTYVVDEEESWTIVTDPSILEDGDQIVITDEDSTVGMIPYASGNNCKTTAASGQTAISVSGNTLSSTGSAAIITLSTANSSNGTFYMNDGTNYLYAASSSGNQLKGKDSTDSSNGAWKFTYSDGKMGIVAYGSSNRNVMQYNSGDASNLLFAVYSSASYKGMQVYKKSGGATEYTVDETLFNGVHNNFGEGKTYAWDAACSSFNSTKWGSAGTTLTGISGFANYKLNLAVADANGNEIEQFLAKYDNIITKFGTSYDFLGRFAENGINHGAARIIPNPLLKGNTNTAIIVVIVSAISIVAVGGYFLLRKKKED
jgi:hypothetical protein